MCVFFCFFLGKVLSGNAFLTLSSVFISLIGTTLDSLKPYQVGPGKFKGITHFFSLFLSFFDTLAYSADWAGCVLRGKALYKGLSQWHCKAHLQLMRSGSATMELLCLSLERRGSLLAEGRFLSDLIVSMQSPFLVAEASSRDPSSCTRRECDSWNLVVMRAKGPFGGQTSLSRAVTLQGHCTW